MMEYDGARQETVRLVKRMFKRAIVHEEGEMRVNYLENGLGG